MVGQSKLLEAENDELATGDTPAIGGTGDTPATPAIGGTPWQEVQSRELRLDDLREQACQLEMHVSGLTARIYLLRLEHDRYRDSPKIQAEISTKLTELYDEFDSCFDLRHAFATKVDEELRADVEPEVPSSTVGDKHLLYAEVRCRSSPQRHFEIWVYCFFVTAANLPQGRTPRSMWPQRRRAGLWRHDRRCFFH